MSPELLKTRVEIAIEKDLKLDEFLRTITLSGTDEEQLINMSKHSDVLIRVFMFDHLVKLPPWLQRQLNFFPKEERNITNLDLNIKMNVLFKKEK